MDTFIIPRLSVTLSSLAFYSAAALASPYFDNFAELEKRVFQIQKQPLSPREEKIAKAILFSTMLEDGFSSKSLEILSDPIYRSILEKRTVAELLPHAIENGGIYLAIFIAHDLPKEDFWVFLGADQLKKTLSSIIKKGKYLDRLDQFVLSKKNLQSFLGDGGESVVAQMRVDVVGRNLSQNCSNLFQSSSKKNIKKPAFEHWKNSPY